MVVKEYSVYEIKRDPSLSNKQTLRGKTKYRIHYDFTSTSKETFDLYVVSDYEFGGDQSIIIKESATGNGGVTYSNGRLQEAIPINGTLVASSKDEVEAMASKIMQLKDAGEVVELVMPFNNYLRSNRFFIQSCKFTVGNDDKSLGFSMNFTEARSFNVKEIEVNLVTFDVAEELIALNNALIGNIEE